MKFNVHVYCVVTTKISVEAKNHQEAADKAAALAPEVDFGDGEYADDFLGALVDVPEDKYYGETRYVPLADAETLDRLYCRKDSK
jgi:hypothetical protein